MGVAPQKTGPLHHRRYEVDLREVNKRVLAKLLPADQITVAKSVRLAGEDTYRTGRLARQRDQTSRDSSLPAVYYAPRQAGLRPPTLESFANGVRNDARKFTIFAALQRVTEYEITLPAEIADYTEDVYDIHALLQSAVPVHVNTGIPEGNRELPTRL